jgi:hypothetical protein
MAYVDWRIEGPNIGGCSCDYGCPCEFNALPTRAPCEGFSAMEVRKGHFGDVSLDGLRFAALFLFPKAVHLGAGEALGFIDERADARQREALLAIVGGKEQAPTTHFNIYGSMIAKEYPPVFTPIEFDCDVAGRTGRVRIPGHVELDVAPIRNPVTGKPHRAQIRLPEGFEFHEAEMASANMRAGGQIPMSFSGRYAALYDIAYGPDGIID